ncbi:amidohydrolase [Ornithinicoccus hortensis]|uniref:amidohydrolase n=1 Tax=Ornithinicoccus hortensis TaxID=82346 RepID=UPI003CC81AD9
MTATTPPELQPVPSIDDLIERVVQTVEGRRDDLVQWRRTIHRHPEVSYQEHQTTALVSQRMQEAGLVVRTLPGSGATVDLGAAEPRVRIALRADLDALPVDEMTGLPFASRKPGVCHACGHDVHTVGVLGAGLALAAIEEELVALGVGVRLIFQPAEESMPGGAHDVMAAGGLDGVDRLFAVHCDPSVDVGSIGLKVGPITAASDSVHVTLTGRGGHTSRPHLTQDITYALGKVITDVPAALSRRLDPRSGTALVWGAVKAGSVANVIPARGECVGTLRMLDSETWDTAGPLIKEIVQGVVAPYGVTAEVRYVKGVPPVDNDAATVSAFTAAATAVAGPTSVVSTRQSLGGEDLGWYLTKVPGAMARLGTRAPGGPTYELHQGDLVVDEEAIGIAAKLLAACVLTSVDPAGLV